METMLYMGLRAILETMIDMGLRAILRSSTGNNRLCTASRACSCVSGYCDLIPNMLDYVYSDVSPLSFR
eukprot:4808935-Pleurochrysis_carterae.AAC.1